MTKLPDLSRFELECLRRLWERREATVREVHEDLPDAPSYSTVRKIFERLEDKGAVVRTGMSGTACLYRSAVPASAVIRREIRRLLESLFDGSAKPLVSHLAEMDALSLADLKALEERLGGEAPDSKPARGRHRGRRR